MRSLGIPLKSAAAPFRNEGDTDAPRQSFWRGKRTSTGTRENRFECHLTSHSQVLYNHMAIKELNLNFQWPTATTFASARWLCPESVFLQQQRGEEESDKIHWIFMNWFHSDSYLLDSEISGTWPREDGPLWDSVRFVSVFGRPRSLTHAFKINLSTSTTSTTGHIRIWLLAGLQPAQPVGQRKGGTEPNGRSLSIYVCRLHYTHIRTLMNKGSSV